MDASIERSPKRAAQRVRSPQARRPLGPGAAIAWQPAGLNGLEQVAFQKLVQAISERRLLPGVRLVEEDLAARFDLSRERIRRILLVLSQHGMITLEPNRGAYVTRPTLDQRRDAFETRRLIERHVIAVLCRLDRVRRTEVVAELRRHIVAENRARTDRDRADVLRLSALFHLKLAGFAGNQVLVRVLQDVVAQMSLAMAAHYHGHSLDCSLNEHAPLLEAIAAGDATQADALIVAHLAHMEEALAEALGDDPLPPAKRGGRRKSKAALTA